MADAVAAELERQYRTTETRTGRALSDGDLVFGDPITGGPLSKKMLLSRFRRALEAARLDPTRRFHDLRHTFGTQMAVAGVAIRTLQEWMGHRDIQTTMRYADYAPSAHEAEVIAAAFGSGRSRNIVAISRDPTAPESTLEPADTGYTT